jgi:DNA-binding NarL/FixJ family response regulator
MTDPAASPAPLRVLLVDPDERILASLAGLLCIGNRCLVVGAAGSAEVALGLAADSAPDVVVVDPRLPGIEAGAALIARIRETCPAARILVLSSSGSADQDCGADAYTRKTFRPQELIDAVVSTSRPSVT